MKRVLIFVFIIVLMIGLIQSQAISKIKTPRHLKLLIKTYVKVLVMNKWNNGQVKNAAMVVLKKMNPTGAVINNAQVVVNNHQLNFNNSIQEYMGDIGTVTPGQGVLIVITLPNGDVIKGKVKAKYFVKIVVPNPFTSFWPHSSILVKWLFTDGGVYSIVLKVLKGSTQLFSTTVNNSLSYVILLRTLNLPIAAGDVIAIRVISPWVSQFTFIGPYATASKADFFSSATVKVKIK